jgi:ribosomal protein L10
LRKKYGGLKVDQARRLRELGQENAKLKCRVSELSVAKWALKDTTSENFQVLNDGAVRWSSVGHRIGCASGWHVV